MLDWMCLLFLLKPKLTGAPLLSVSIFITVNTYVIIHESLLRNNNTTEQQVLASFMTSSSLQNVPTTTVTHRPSHITELKNPCICTHDNNVFHQLPGWSSNTIYLGQLLGLQKPVGEEKVHQNHQLQVKVQPAA